MAKAHKFALMGLAVGLAFTPTQAYAQQLGTPTENIAVSGQPVAAPTAAQVHVVLRSGADCYRKGEYELGARYLQQAKAGEANLSADEKRDLATWLSLTNTALEARRNGVNQLKFAEDAANKGKMQEAASWLKGITPNKQFLSAADKLRVQQLEDRVTPGAPKSNATGPVDNVAASQARTKLKLARQLLAKGNYDGADAMAKEADQMHAVYSAGEDTPARVLNDVVAARLRDGSLNNDPKALLVAARSAMGRGDFDLADKLAHQAEKNTSFFGSMTSSFQSDTPAKVLKEIQAARLYASSTRSAPAKAPNVAVAAAPRSETTDPRLLVRQGRDLFNMNKLEDAEKVALHANSMARSVSWGYFEDTPDKLIADINKAKTKRNQEESVRVLADARRQFAQGNLVEAEKLANRAERLHGPYGVMEMGDRPQKLLAEIETTRARNHISRVPTAQVAAKDNPPAAGSPTAPQAQAPFVGQQALPNNPAPTSNQQMASQGASPYGGQSVGQQALPNNPAPASNQQMASQGASPYGSQSGASAPTPAPYTMPNTGMASTGTGNRQSPVVPSWPSQTGGQANVNVTVPTPSAVAGEAKMKAQACLVEARALLRDGRLLEARQKAVEAQKLNVTFRLDEDKPEVVLMAVNSACQKKIDALMGQADYYVKAGQTDARNFQMAEQQLVAAKQLATGFNVDSYQIDMKFNQVHQSAATAKTSMPSQNSSTATATAQNHDQGRDLLEKARQELRAGQLANARRLANEAFSPSMGVQKEAADLLRSIDTEEFNQKVLVASRTFDAAVSAHNRHEIAQAQAMFKTIDVHLLPPDKQARLSDYLRAEPTGTSVAQTSRWQDQQPATTPVIPTMRALVLPAMPEPVMPTMPQSAWPRCRKPACPRCRTRSYHRSRPMFPKRLRCRLLPLSRATISRRRLISSLKPRRCRK